jgi:hypothetical protein
VTRKYIDLSLTSSHNLTRAENLNVESLLNTSEQFQVNWHPKIREVCTLACSSLVRSMAVSISSKVVMTWVGGGGVENDIMVMQKFVVM